MVTGGASGIGRELVRAFAGAGSAVVVADIDLDGSPGDVVVVVGRRIQVDYLKRRAPDLARIPWQPYGANLYRLKHWNTWLLPQRAWRKAARVLRGRRSIERNWEIQFFGTQQRARLEAAFDGSGRKIHEFIAPTHIQGLLDRFYARPLSPTKPGYTVSMLLTFASWLERYS